MPVATPVSGGESGFSILLRSKHGGKKEKLNINSSLQWEIKFTDLTGTTFQSKKRLYDNCLECVDNPELPKQ